MGYEIQAKYGLLLLFSSQIVLSLMSIFQACDIGKTDEIFALD
jgi:hypothetical protein